METMTGKVCVDCLMVLAGYPHDELGYDVSASIAAIERKASSGVYVDIACEEDCEGGFSWFPCSLCKSPLGGDRHRVMYSWSANSN